MNSLPLEPHLPLLPDSSSTMQPEELNDFRSVLVFLKAYPFSPKKTPTSTTTKMPVGKNAGAEFSLWRLLRVLGWSLYVTLSLLLIMALLVLGQAIAAVVTLLIALPLPVFAVSRARRRARKDVVPTEVQDTTGHPLVPVVSNADRVHEDDLGLSSECLNSDDVYPLLDNTTAATPNTPSLTRRLIVFAVSLSLWIAVAVSSLPDLTTTWLVSTIVLHEVGHFAAMFFLGYTNLGMFFIPFIAGAVTGKKSEETQDDRLIMLLSGPAPGLLMGCLIYWIDTFHPMPFARSIAIWLVAINFLNLLPIWPLDGGRICWSLFSRHSAMVQAALSVCSFVGFSFLFFAPNGGITFLIVMGLLLLWWTPPRFRYAQAALSVYRLYPKWPESIKQLSGRQLLELFRVATRSQSTSQRATDMIQIYERVALIPHSPAPIRYFVWYILLFVATLATAAGTALQTDARTTSDALGTLFDSVMPD